MEKGYVADYKCWSGTTRGFNDYDLTIMKGHDETPENHSLTILKGFSTVSEGSEETMGANMTYKAWRLVKVKG